jgi:hypothetical protein
LLDGKAWRRLECAYNAAMKELMVSAVAEADAITIEALAKSKVFMFH